MSFGKNRRRRNKCVLEVSWHVIARQVLVRGLTGIVPWTLVPKWALAPVP